MMGSRVKIFLRAWLPPVLMNSLLKLRCKQNFYKGHYELWSDAASISSGYETEEILAKVLASTMKVVRGEAAYERDSIPFNKIEYSWPVTAGLMYAAAKSSGELNVIDFGGSLGSSFFQNRHFLEGLQKMTWSVIEQSHYVLAGIKHVQYDNLRFYDSVDQSINENIPNVFLLSSVLQYLPDTAQIFKEVDNSGATILIVDKTPFSQLDKDIISIQIVPKNIYHASYPMKIFSKNKFIQTINSRWRLIEEFDNQESIQTTSLGLKFSFSGMIFERVDD